MTVPLIAPMTARFFAELGIAMPFTGATAEDESRKAEPSRSNQRTADLAMRHDWETERALTPRVPIIREAYSRCGAYSRCRLTAPAAQHSQNRFVSRSTSGLNTET